MKFFEHFKRKDHIKYAFLFKDKSTINFSSRWMKPRYLFGYLTDDHKVYFDEFRIMNVSTYNRGMILQFLKKTRHHYIDSKTEVCFFFGKGRKYQYNDIMYLLWALYHRGYGFHMTRLDPGVMVKSIDGTYDLHVVGKYISGDGHMMNINTSLKSACKIFDILLKNRVCSWINDEFNQRISLIRGSRMKFYKVVSVGLYYMLIRNYNRYITQYRAARHARLNKLPIPESEATMIKTGTILSEDISKEENSFDLDTTDTNENLTEGEK